MQMNVLRESPHEKWSDDHPQCFVAQPRNSSITSGPMQCSFSWRQVQMGNTRNPDFYQYRLPSTCFTLLSPDVSVTACEFELSTEVNCTHFKEKGWCSYALSPIQFKSLLIQSELCLDSISPKLKIPQKTCFITCLMASSLSLLAFKTRENTWF